MNLLFKVTDTYTTYTCPIRQNCELNNVFVRDFSTPPSEAQAYARKLEEAQLKIDMREGVFEELNPILPDTATQEEIDDAFNTASWEEIAALVKPDTLGAIILDTEPWAGGLNFGIQVDPSCRDGDRCVEKTEDSSDCPREVCGGVLRICKSFAERIYLNA